MRDAALLGARLLLGSSLGIHVIARMVTNEPAPASASAESAED